MEAVKLRELADSVAICHSEYTGLKCSNGHRFNVFPSDKCEWKGCEQCAGIRQRKAFKRALPKIRKFQELQPSMRLVQITLTVRNTRRSLSSIHDLFKQDFRRLRATPEWQRHIAGGIVGYEVTGDEARGWHFHCHILAFRKKWWEQADLSRAWESACKGRGSIVDIREVKDVEDGLRHVLKYVFKPADLLNFSPRMVLQFWRLASSGKRLSDTLGDLRNVMGVLEDEAETACDELSQDETELASGCLCPTCGEALQVERLSFVEWERVRATWARDG